MTRIEPDSLGFLCSADFQVYHDRILAAAH